MYNVRQIDGYTFYFIFYREENVGICVETLESAEKVCKTLNGEQ